MKTETEELWAMLMERERCGGSMKTDTEELWAMLMMSGGLTLLARFLPTKEGYAATREAVEDVLCNSHAWLALDRAYSVVTIPANTAHGMALAPYCVPFGMSVGEEQKVSICVAHVSATMFFEDMDKATLDEMKRRIKQGADVAMSTRSKASGIALAR